MKKWIAGLTLAALSLGFAAQAEEEGPFAMEIEARQGLMVYRAINIGTLAAMAKGEAEYDAAKAKVAVGDIEKLVVWGNHSPTMYPDYRFATAGGRSLKALIDDEAWNRTEFMPKVGKRGAAIIEARGLSSAASAANAAIDHMRDWVLGTQGKWVTMGIPSDGSYGIPEGVMYGVPVTCANGEYTRIEGLPVDDFSRAAMDKTLAELEEERAGVAHLL